MNFGVGCSTFAGKPSRSDISITQKMTNGNQDVTYVKICHFRDDLTLGVCKGHNRILNECHGLGSGSLLGKGPGAPWRALNARWNEAGP
jgi:hypothetical protein